MTKNILVRQLRHCSLSRLCRQVRLDRRDKIEHKNKDRRSIADCSVKALR
jgi:hypothetical protein